MIATDIDNGDLIYCADDGAGGLISAIGAGDSKDYDDIAISDDTGDELIAADSVNFMDWADTNI